MVNCGNINVNSTEFMVNNSDLFWLKNYVAKSALECLSLFVRFIIHTCFLLLVLLSSTPGFSKEDPYKIIKDNSQDTLTVKAYIKLSASSLKYSYDSAIYYAKQGMALASSIDYGKGYTACLIRLGNAYMNQGLYDSATNAYMEALEYYKKIDYAIGVGKVYNNLGLMNRYKADYVESAKYFMKSLEVKKKHGDEIDVGIGYHNLGIVFAIQKDYETAEKYLLDALQRFENAGDSSKYYSVLLDVSSMYREQGKVDASIKSLKACYRYNKANGRKTSFGISNYNLALTYYLKGDMEQAINYYKESKRIFTELGNKIRANGCNLRLAICYRDLGEYKRAEPYLFEGLETCKMISSPVQEYELLDVLADVYAKQGKYQEAYQIRMDYSSLKDSIISEEHSVKIAELQAKHEGELDKRKIAELTAENKQSQLNSRKQEVRTYFLVGGIILIFLLAIMFYSRVLSKKKINDALREKNSVIAHSLEEKEVLLREIYHRVQNNLQFVSSLLNLQSRRVEDQGTKEVLKECKLRIQSMALIHQRLYQEDSLKGISFASYLKNLINTLQQSYQIEEGRIATVLNIEDVRLDLDTAIPLGLILNELITNAYKYAFPNNAKGELKISLKKQDSGLLLKVADNGVGISKLEEIDKSNSFGLKLVNSLAQKLNAEVKFEVEQGTEVILHMTTFKEAV